MMTARGATARLCAALAAAACAFTCHAATLSEMQNVGTVSFCLNPDAMPYSQRDDTDEVPGNGFLYDISTELIRRLGLSGRVIWLNSLERLNKTECDLVPSALVEDDDLGQQAARLAREPDKIHNRLFIRPYARSGGFLVAQGKRYDSFDSLRDTHVAVPSGSYAQVILNRARIPIWVRFLTDDEIIEAVREGIAGAGLVTRVGFEWYLHRHPGTGLSPLAIDVTEFQLDSDIGMMLRTADSHTLAAFDDALAKMAADGFIAKAMRRYGVSHVRPAP